MRREFFALIALVFLCSTVSAQSLSGSGTKNNPFRITSSSDFDIFLSDFKYRDRKTYVRLEVDLNLGGASYSGSVASGPMNAIFDGGGHTISNFTVNGSSQKTGFFTEMANGSIVDNLHLADFSITGNENYTGAIVGFNNACEIYNCSVSGTINGAGNVGGICGVNNGYVSNCKVNAEITSSGSYTGGICGIGSNYIKDCVVSGTIRGTSNIGGISGKLGPGTLALRCVSTMEIYGNGDSVGGIAGYSQGIIKHCRASNTVSMQNVSGGHNYTGGLCGYNRYGDIFESFSYADVKGYNRTGGICGINYGDAIIRNCYFAGSVEGNNRVGGICGFQYQSSSRPTIDKCLSFGSIKGGSQIGGIIGYNYNENGTHPGLIKDCYWDVETDGVTETNDESLNGVLGKETAHMKLKETYIGWDFLGEDTNGTEDIWRLCIDGTGYPKLTWQHRILGDIACEDGTSLEDLELLAANWLTNSQDDNWDPIADVTRDSKVDINDFAVMAENWE